MERTPLPLHRYPDDVLTKVCTPVTDEERAARADDLIFTQALTVCRQNHGYAIAAPQVGDPKRWFVVDAHRQLGLLKPEVFINPRILSMGGERVSESEGCLSLPGLRVAVTRPQLVDLEWVDEAGVPRVRYGIKGLFARVVLHEMDHLQGVLNVSRTDALGKKRAEPALQAMRQSR